MSRTKLTVSRAHTQGFTLIELLVVISIIALLISILLPTLARARESARNALCLSRMRQVGIASFSYRVDSKQYFPVCQMNGGATYAYPGWGDEPYWFVNQVAPYLNMTTPEQLDFYSTPSKNYLQCPANGWEGYKGVGGFTYIRSFVNAPGSAMTWNYGPPVQYGYLYWNQWKNYAGANYRPKNRDPLQPSNQMLTSEGVGRVGYVTGGIGGIRYYHLSNSSNVLMADGHVTSFKENEFAESGIVYLWPQP